MKGARSRLARFGLIGWLAYDFVAMARFLASGGRALVDIADVVVLAAIGTALIGVVRRPEPLAVRIDAAALAACGLGLGLMTAAILLAGVPYQPTTASTAIELGAACLLLWSTVTLGSSFAVLPAAIRCTATGPYAFVRHPIYAAYILWSLAFALAYPHPVVACAAALETAALCWRATLEEGLLRAALPEYRGYCGRVRHRFVPGIA